MTGFTGLTGFFLRAGVRKKGIGISRTEGKGAFGEKRNVKSFPPHPSPLPRRGEGVFPLYHFSVG